MTHIHEFETAARKLIKQGIISYEILEEMRQLLTDLVAIESDYRMHHKDFNAEGQKQAQHALADLLELRRSELIYLNAKFSLDFEANGWRMLDFFAKKYFIANDYTEAMSLALQAIQGVEELRDSGRITTELRDQLLSSYQYNLSRYESCMTYMKQLEHMQQDDGVDEEYEVEELAFAHKAGNR
ncbi:MAG: hypothetical protein GY835_27185 [bacterium]|nr:hypothetical protein [bacterium]